MSSLGFLRSLTTRTLASFVADRSGATAIEYGLMVALIGLAILSTVFALGLGIKDTLYGGIVNALTSM